MEINIYSTPQGQLFEIIIKNSKLTIYTTYINNGRLYLQDTYFWMIGEKGLRGRQNKKKGEGGRGNQGER